MTDLPNVTMVIADCKNTGKAVSAIRKSLHEVKPARTIFFTDAMLQSDEFEVININTLRSSENYSKFIVKKLDQFIQTSHVLIIQHDGYVLDGNAWSDDFLQYDYIGATWNYKDGRNVGNGGFSLRSKKLQTILATDEFIDQYHPEDEIIGRLYRNYLISKYNIKIAPDDVAERFSYECNRPFVNTFGFHGGFWPSYREPVIVRRTASMGDVIMMEPLLRYLYEQGKRVIIDTPLDYWNLFMRHFYQIEHINCLDPREDPSSYRLINLDMTYENQPKKLVLKTYYEAAGVVNGPLVNPQLNFRNNEHTRLFHNYIVLHIDDTAMSHRNIHGVDWNNIVEYIESFGYDVVQVGRNKTVIAGISVQTFSEEVLAYVISGADGFIGIDSGPSQIAVACDIPSMIFFGSVNPVLRYANFEKITIVQNECPVKRNGCYHEVVSVNGQDCEVNKDQPPCITHTTAHIQSKVHNFMVQIKR